MNKMIVILPAISLLIVSCMENLPVSIEKEPVVKYLTEVTKNGKVERKYHYNSQFLVDSMQTFDSTGILTDVVKFKYTAQGKLNGYAYNYLYKLSESSTLSFYGYTEIELDSLGGISEIKFFKESSDTISATRKHIYDDMHRCIRSAYDALQDSVKYHVTFVYDGFNMVTARFYDKNKQPCGTLYYERDTMVNPEWYMSNNLVNGSPNNIISLKSSSYDNNGLIKFDIGLMSLNCGFVYESTFEYDSDRYPVKEMRVVKSVLPDTSVYEYKYF
jgi:hypothetical protein